jgi:hypothetical protein
MIPDTPLVQWLNDAGSHPGELRTWWPATWKATPWAAG